MSERVFNSLSSALEAGNTNEVKKIVTGLAHNSLNSWSDGYMFLQNILSSRQIKIAKLLINRGCPLISSSEGNTVLHTAVVKGDLEVVKMILRKGVSAFNSNRDGMIPLHMLPFRFPIDKQLLQILDLISSRTHINTKNSLNGYTALHYAAELGNSGIIPFLQLKKSFMNVKSLEDLTPLHLAAMKGHADTVSLLISYGARINVRDKKKRSPLCLAVESGNFPSVEIILNQSLLLKRQKNEAWLSKEDRMLMHCAVGTKNAKIVQLLFSKGVLVNVYSVNTGKTPLHVAVEQGSEEIVAFLLQAGSKPNAPVFKVPMSSQNPVSTGCTALHIAVEFDFGNIVDLLLKHGAEPNSMDENGKTPLHLAIRNGSLPIVTSLLSLSNPEECFNSKIESKLLPSDEESLTPIHLVVKNGNPDILELFLKSGISPNVFSKTGLTPLHIAVQNEDKGLVLLLLKYGADVEVTEPNYIFSSLSLAAEVGNEEIFGTLSEACSSRSSDWTEGYIPLYFAANQGHVNIVRILLEKGVNPNRSRENYLTPLHAASLNGHCHIVDLLLQFGAEVNSSSTSKPFSTPLLASLYFGDDEIASLLLNRGANVNVQLGAKSREYSSYHERLLKYGNYFNSDISRDGAKVGYSPLHFAVESGKEKIVKMLLDRGAKVNVKSVNGVVPIRIAVEKERETIIRFLLMAGAKVSTPEKCEPLLHIAIRKRNVSIVKILLQADVAVNAEFPYGTTALMVAVQGEMEEIVQLLLDAGANFHLDLQGEPILNVALLLKNTSIAKSLLRAGVDVNLMSVSNTALDIAVRNELESIICDLLNAGCNPYSYRGEPPLLLAVSKRNERIAKMLMDFVDVNLVFENKTALGIAVNEELTTTVGNLLEAGADPNILTAESQPLIITAIVKKNADIVELLLRYNAWVNFSCSWSVYGNYPSFLKNDYNPLYIAVWLSTPEIVQLLLKNRAIVDIETKEFPLHKAISRKNEEMMKMLIKYGASVDSICHHRKTPLVHAVEESFVEGVRLLLNNGASVGVRTVQRETLLHLALDKGDDNIIKMLLDCGIDVNAESDRGNAIYRLLKFDYKRSVSSLNSSPIDYTTVPNFEMGFEKVKEEKIDEEESEENRERFLNNLEQDLKNVCEFFEREKEREDRVESRSVFLLKLFLEYDANPNSFGIFGESLLFLAAENKNARAVEALIQNGADINVINSSYADLKSLINEDTFDLSNMEHLNWCPLVNSFFIRAKKVSCSIIQEIARLRAMNEDIHVYYLKLMSSPKLRLYYETCQREIEEMRRKEIHNWLTYFDILTGSENKIAMWLRNEKVTEILDSKGYEHYFPLYNEFLSSRIARGQRLNLLLNLSADSFGKVFGLEFPDLVLEKIFNYLSTQDLRKVCIACDPRVFLNS